MRLLLNPTPGPVPPHRTPSRYLRKCSQPGSRRAGENASIRAGPEVFCQKKSSGKRVSKLKGPRDPAALSSLRLQRTGLSGWETSGFRPARLACSTVRLTHVGGREERDGRQGGAATQLFLS